MLRRVPLDTPAPVRITDYAAPVFTPAGQAIVDGIASIAGSVHLDPDALIADACTQTGLSDFGDPSFRARLDLLVDALEREAGLSAVGRVMQYGQLLQLLKNRLLVEDAIARHPEVLDIEITAPIVIAGMPRTGTTHLHNLTASDPALRSLSYWEALEPVPAPGETVPAGGVDPRVERTELATSTINTLMPYFPRMHEMDAHHVHEEIQLLAIDFSTMLFETSALMPSWRDAYFARDQAPSYAYMKKVLQLCQWQRGGTRWVLKSPQHLEQFPALLATFPDATFVVTHRDPVAITASFTTMVTYTARMNVEKIDPHAYGAYWSQRVEDLLRACVRDRDLLPADRTVDVRFSDFMRDDIAMAREVYRVAGQPFTDATFAAMQRFMAEHPRGKYGRVVYDLADFGIDAEARRESLRFYSDRFAVEDE